MAAVSAMIAAGSFSLEIRKIVKQAHPACPTLWSWRQLWCFGNVLRCSVFELADSVLVHPHFFSSC